VPRALAITGVGLIVGLANSAFVPLRTRPADPLSPPSDGAPSPGTVAPSQTPALGLNITIEQAHELFSRNVPFLDSRHLPEFEAGHVQNAFWLTADQFMSGKVPGVLQVLDPQAQVVVYCGGGECDASKNVVVFLQGLGFSRCHIMTDGYPAWVAAGHPTGTGKPEIGAE